MRVFGSGCEGGWCAGPWTGLGDYAILVEDLALSGTCNGLVGVSVHVDVTSAATGARLRSARSELAFVTVSASGALTWFDRATAEARAVRAASVALAADEVADEGNVVGLEVSP